MDVNTDQHEQPSNELPYKLLTVDEVDVDFLPLIYEIIRSVERDTHDTSQKTNQSQDTSQKVIELHKKLEFAREQFKNNSAGSLGYLVSRKECLSHTDTFEEVRDAVVEEYDKNVDVLGVIQNLIIEPILIRRLSGVEYSKEEQLEKLETLRKQLRLKRELLLKYRNMYTFDMPKSNYS